MKRILMMLTILNFSFLLHAQSAEDSVKAVINSLFAGMKGANAEMIKAAFSDSAILQTISRNKEGRMVVVTDKVDDFASLVGTLKKDSADERIVFGVIKIDGPLAMAWTPYNFFYNGKFDHCGANSFQLVRLDGLWKIQYLIDTRRRKGCEN